MAGTNKWGEDDLSIISDDGFEWNSSAEKRRAREQYQLITIS
jgi:hypothetical protein